MSCILKKIKNTASSSKSFENQSQSVTMASSSVSSEISASELSYLKAQVWTLENRLKEEKKGTKNITNSFKDLANQKYELLEELTKQKQSYQQIYVELTQERENSLVLMNEVECLQGELDKNRAFLKKVVTQNVELKESIIHANETIHHMGLIYLKLKEKSTE